MINIKSLHDMGKNYSVLYVEDNLEIQEQIFQYISRFFKNIERADNGLEALEIYAKKKFDLVITDLSMPKMNGIDMLRKIRELNAQQAVLITSAHSESDYMIQAIKLGVDGYIIKPFDYEQLNFELFKVVQKIEAFAQNKEYKIHLEHMVSQKTAELQSMIHFQKYNYEKTLYSMVEMIEDRDTYTAGHSQRVAHYSRLIAKEMNFSSADCDKVYQAGILHDIGKIATPDVVLLKPKKLNDLEYKLIKEHVNVGYKLLLHIPMFENLAEIVHCHHEKFDGSGYPRGISDAEIPPLAKVMMVADAFDAMTTNRVYKGRKSVKNALLELQSLVSIHYHPDVVKSASIALRNVEIDENIGQLPHTAVEKERFAYFYNDILTSAYNQSYLNVVLVRNGFEKKYTQMGVFRLSDFSKYNKIYGWSKGDELLKTIVKIFQKSIQNLKVFRIFGDYFVILSQENYEIEKIHNEMDKLLQKTNVKYQFKMLDLSQIEINKVTDIEKIF